MSYSPELAPDFKRLNEAWISSYFTLEPLDVAMLERPDSFIIEPGGHIYFLEAEGRIVGTYALYKLEEPGHYELAKMAVDETQRGKGYGRLLMSHAIEQAHQLKAEALILRSNSQLKSALRLYKAFGFVDAPDLLVAGNDYARANVAMRLRLKSE